MTAMTGYQNKTNYMQAITANLEPQEEGLTHKLERILFSLFSVRFQHHQVIMSYTAAS